MFRYIFYLFGFGLLIHQTFATTYLDLGGSDWQFKNEKETIKGKATVPGNIFQDLKNNKVIDDLYYEYSDVNNSWIANESWIYSKKFTVSTKNVKLVANSLDTLGQILINDKVVANFENMFVKQEIYLNDFVNVNKENTIKIKFDSPINYVNQRADAFYKANGYNLPPANSPSSYNGLPHANFVRKMQASFSWDWGPQIATSGIVDKIYLVIEPSPVEVDSVIVDTVRVNSSTDNKLDWIIRSKVNLKLNKDNLNMLSNFKFYLNGKEVKSKNQNSIRITGKQGSISVNEFEIGPFAEQDILPWFPNMFDYLQESKERLKPNLYKFTVQLEKQDDSSLINKKSFRIGFREIKIIEKPLNDGRSFYFQINGIPFHARGMNYIPTTLNIGNLTEQKTKFTYLLNQVKSNNMNMIRVWGGGFYPLDEFYQIADELGILIWQDFMYACALYEADDKHLALAEEEVSYQVRRLQHHPSIAVFAGNNEIEGAISSKWYAELSKPESAERLKTDYINLFEKKIRNVVTTLTSSIPYLGSSPTNNDNQIFVKTGDPRKGDIHFYDYNSDTLNEKKYPRARFASEFGYQSYPSLATLSKSLDKEHLAWPITPEIEHREHAPGQTNKLIAQITENFIFKNQNSTGQEALDEFIYLSQVSQALAIKVEAELYIRDRDSNLWLNDYSLRPKVQNLNMGTLIWQLNDVWPAPTWSSIDFYGNYKILQYYIRKFYNPIHVIANRENDTLVVSLINDSLVRVKMTVYVIIYKNVNGYLEPAPVATYKNVTYLDKLTVLKQNLDLKSRLDKAGCGDRPDQCFIRIDYTYLNFYLDNFYLLGKPKDLNLKPVEIKRKIMKLPQAPKKYVVVLTCDQVALFVQLSWKDLNIEGHFIDNGFNILKTELYILFEAKEDYDLNYLIKNLKVRSINSN